MSRTGHSIKVATVPNGYTLIVDGCEFMYFNEQGLVEGIFVHVGLGINDYLSNDDMKALITACATWPKEGDAIQAAAQLQSDNELMRDKILRLRRTVNECKERIQVLTGEATKQRLARKAQMEADAKRDEPGKIRNPLLIKERPVRAGRPPKRLKLSED